MEVGPKLPDREPNQDSDGIPYPQKLVPVETFSKILCVQRKVGCRLLN